MPKSNKIFKKPPLKQSWPQSTCGDRGLTLVELMMAVALSGFVISAIYMSFRAQQRAAVVQENVTDMQQNLRAAAYVMGSEIRMAGFDPKGTTNATINTATSSTISFTMDINGNGSLADSGDNVTYSLYSSNQIPTLGRKAPANNAAVAEYIEYLEFLYYLKDGSNSSNPAILSDIRRVTISMLTRSSKIDTDYTNTNNYPKLSGGNIDLSNDVRDPPSISTNYRRRQLTTTITCRNMGI